MAEGFRDAGVSRARSPGWFYCTALKTAYRRRREVVDMRLGRRAWAGLRACEHTVAVCATARQANGRRATGERRAAARGVESAYKRSRRWGGLKCFCRRLRVPLCVAESGRRADRRAMMSLVGVPDEQRSRTQRQRADDEAAKRAAEVFPQLSIATTAARRRLPGAQILSTAIVRGVITLCTASTRGRPSRSSLA